MFFVFVIAIVVLIRIAKEQKALSAQREAQRIRAEQDRAKREAAWRREMEKEQRRIDAEQIRQRKEQDRIAKEQAKQAAQIAKHEEEIKQLQSKMNNYVQIVRDMRQRVANLEELHDIAEKEYLSADQAGDDTRREKALKKIVSLDNQIAAAKEKSRKAKANWNAAQRKISA